MILKAFHPFIISCNNSGAPTRALRACDRAPYSQNMVNLFSFAYHVIGRAYVRTRLQIVLVGRGDYEKEGRGSLCDYFVYARL